MSRANGGRNYPPDDYYDDRQRDYYDDRQRDYYRPPRRGPPVREYDEVDVDITRTQSRPGPDYFREDYRMPSGGQLVISERDRSRGPSRDAPRRPTDDEYDSQDEVLIRQRRPRRERPPPPREEFDVDVDVRRGSRAPRPRPRDREVEEVEVDIREDNYERPRRRRRDPPPEEVDITINNRESRRAAPPPAPAVPGGFEEEIIVRRGEGARGPPEIIVNDREVDMPTPGVGRRPREVDEVDINIREDLEPPPPSRQRRRRDRDREEIDVNISRDPRERQAPQDSTIVIRERSKSRGAPRIIREREEFVYRRRPPSSSSSSPSPPPPPPPPQNTFEEIVIRRRREPSPSPSPPPPPEPEPEPEPDPIPTMPPIIRPPIIQEVITHHRTIEHGVVRAPPSESSSSSSSPSPPPPPRRKKEKELQIDIRRRDNRGNILEEDIRIIDDTRSERSARSSRPEPRPEPKPEPKEVKNEREVVRFAPPRRVREETNINIDLDLSSGRALVAAPPPTRAPPKQLWTEVTKDLVSREAIEKIGYEYEETDDFFYIMVYLRFEDMEELVSVTEDLQRNRRERIEEIQWERKDPRLAKAPTLSPPSRSPQPRSPPPGFEERIVEREIIYEDRPRRYR